MNVATHIDFCGERFPRNPQDIARDTWIGEQLPARVAALEAQDKALAEAFGDVSWTHLPGALDAFRSGDAIEFLRLVREAVEIELASAADLALQEEAYARYPEAAA
jgi:hypothetical protein